MKNPLIPFIVLTLLILSQACSNKNTSSENNFEPEQVLKFNEEPYNINSVYQFVKDLSIIVLESNQDCIIGEIEKIQTNNNRIYIMDGQSDCLLVFNKDGSFNFKLDKQGRGPGEYQYLRDFYIDKKSNDIVLLGSPHKVLRYSEKGKFISEKKLDFYPLKFHKAKNGFVFWNGNNSEGNPFVTCTNFNFEIVNEWFPVDNQYATGINMLTLNDSEIYLEPIPNQYWNHIFTVDAQNLNLKYLLDFGSHNWPKDGFKMRMRESPRRKKGSFYNISNFFEANNRITFDFVRKGKIHSAVYNLDTRDGFWWKNNFKYNLPATVLHNILSKNNDKLYSVIDANLVSWIKKDLNTYRKASQKFGWPENSIEFDEAEKIINAFNLEDNPLIFSFKLK